MDENSMIDSLTRLLPITKAKAREVFGEISSLPAFRNGDSTGLFEEMFPESKYSKSTRAKIAVFTVAVFGFTRNVNETRIVRSETNV